MSEILKKRLKKSIGKEILLFLNNNFRFEGKITNCDDKYLEILDYKINSYATISLDDIKQIFIKEEKGK